MLLGMGRCFDLRRYCARRERCREWLLVVVVAAIVVVVAVMMVDSRGAGSSNSDGRHGLVRMHTG